MSELASIVILTYNHEAYIGRCLDGVLMQKVDFPIEVLIAEDCSTDGTLSICQEYASRYPDIIRIIPSDCNVGAVANEQRAFQAARGKYIATCEGDDYWTDELKLQKQLDFLESNPDYSVCFHRFRRHDALSGEWTDDGCDRYVTGNEDSIELTMHQAMHQWITQYLTMVFRKDCYDFEAPSRYRYYRDTHQVYHLMLNGRCRLFAFEGGVYHLTGSGEYSTRSAFSRELMTLKVDTELWKVNKDNRWKEMCAAVMQDMIDNFASEKEYRRVLSGYALRIFFIRSGIRKLVKNLISIA